MSDTLILEIIILWLNLYNRHQQTLLTMTSLGAAHNTKWREEKRDHNDINCHLLAMILINISRGKLQGILLTQLFYAWRYLGNNYVHLLPFLFYSSYSFFYTYNLLIQYFAYLATLWSYTLSTKLIKPLKDNPFICIYIIMIVSYRHYFYKTRLTFIITN